MKNFITILIAATFITADTAVYAGTEPRPQDYASAREKVIEHLNETINHHQNMSKEAILADVRSTSRKNIQRLQRQGFDTAQLEQKAKERIAEFEQLDREGMLAVETRDLQAVQTAKPQNFILGICKNADNNTTHECSNFWYILMDIIFFVPEVVLTAVSFLSSGLDEVNENR